MKLNQVSLISRTPEGVLLFSINGTQETFNVFQNQNGWSWKNDQTWPNDQAGWGVLPTEELAQAGLCSYLIQRVWSPAWGAWSLTDEASTPAERTEFRETFQKVLGMEYPEGLEYMD